MDVWLDNKNTKRMPLYASNDREKIVVFLSQTLYHNQIVNQIIIDLSRWLSRLI